MPCAVHLLLQLLHTHSSPQHIDKQHFLSSKYPAQTTKIAIDIDTGDNNPSSGRGAAMARRRLLDHLGWTWVVVRADDWASLGGSADAQERFAGALVHAALDASAGGGGGGGGGSGGHVCGSGCSHDHH
jgi:hypothetical protein